MEFAPKTYILSKANVLWNLFCSTDKFNAQSSLQPLFKSKSEETRMDVQQNFVPRASKLW